MITEQDIYRIAKAWIDKDHENSSVDWIKLMADDLARRIRNEREMYRECLERFTPVKCWDDVNNFLSTHGSGLVENLSNRGI